MPSLKNLLVKLPSLKGLLLKLRILPSDPRPPFGKYLLKHLPVILVIFLLTLVAEHLGWFRGFETWSLDSMLSLRSHPSPIPIYLVLIDDEEYESKFGGRSPLDPVELKKVLDDVASGRPAVIGVDLETAHADFQGHQWPEAVWVRSIPPPVSAEGNSVDARFGPDVLDAVVRGTALGGDLRELPDKHGQIVTAPTTGLPLFLSDHDGVVRRYRRQMFSPESAPPTGRKGQVAAFPWAVAQAYCDSAPEHVSAERAEACRQLNKLRAEPHALTDDVVLNFSGTLDRFDRMNLQKLREAANGDNWTTNSTLAGAIVLVGGAYASGRDVYMTSAGPRLGIEIIAHAIEADLTDGGIGELNHHVGHVLEIVLGIATVAFLWRFPGYRMFLITLLANALLALLASLLVFQTMALWFNFVPMLAGLRLHHWWEKIKHAQELQHEVKTLQAQLAKSKSA